MINPAGAGGPGCCCAGRDRRGGGADGGAGAMRPARLSLPNITP
jgi:hypothetical protein